MRRVRRGRARNPLVPIAGASLRSVVISRDILGHRCEPGLSLRDFDRNARSASWLAVNQHAVVLVIEYFQPLFYVAHSDPFIQNAREFRFRYANAIVLDFDRQPSARLPGPQCDSSSINPARD